ncbi:winged helix-turn-helix domain-containing protein [Marinomonas primoryensis]|jgi:DNA-binding response OmpR family regulator|uniref:OmpR (DNA-binding response regulator) superfamily protein n=1 Tax=Marinomonas primoryensis TaxID=178399 RepID=A0A859CUY4_9GAMM|nr:winged helix-turn-helix domain-containing protein [Marinomonas primoryensis]QKK80234.1 OmpR (DNA-binding response regulator) superfamily protein [Marinomonas primoryensis]|tara:strand:- start:3404 stop:4168 length:765 start_codon:yes stop_codon:yes gene_type:complete
MGNYLLNGKKLILVEDDVELASLVQEFLHKNGYLVEVVTNGIEATRQIIEQQPDLVILDIMLPGLSGMDVCRIVRPAYSGLILMLTSLDEDMDQMLGLELGADDYVIKPVKPRLLLSRIKALLRRVESSHASFPSLASVNNQTINTLSTLEIAPHKRSVSINKQDISLTTAEYDLLNLLINNAGKIVTRETILQSLRGFEYDGIDRSIDRRISRLRKKLNDDPINPKIIKTIRSKGYLLCASIEKTLENESVKT